MTRRGRGGPPGMPGRGGGGGGPTDMLKQMQAMQQRMLEEQEALGDEVAEVSVGGGAVTVVMNGHQKMKSIAIDRELLTPAESEMLSELIVAAVNQAVEQTQRMAAKRMQAITGGMNLPGLGF